jgi:hypothetical protein
MGPGAEADPTARARQRFSVTKAAMTLRGAVTNTPLTGPPPGPKAGGRGGQAPAKPALLDARTEKLPNVEPRHRTETRHGLASCRTAHRIPYRVSCRHRVGLAADRQQSVGSNDCRVRQRFDKFTSAVRWGYERQARPWATTEGAQPASPQAAKQLMKQPRTWAMPVFTSPSPSFFSAPLLAYPEAQCRPLVTSQRQASHSEPDGRRREPRLAAEGVARAAPAAP